MFPSPLILKGYIIKKPPTNKNPNDQYNPELVNKLGVKTATLPYSLVAEVHPTWHLRSSCGQALTIRKKSEGKKSWDNNFLIYCLCIRICFWPSADCPAMVQIYLTQYHQSASPPMRNYFSVRGQLLLHQPLRQAASSSGN